MTIDRSSWWWRRGRALLVVAGGLLVTGWVAEPLQDTAWSASRSRQPELHLQDLEGAVGQGMVMGLLGGFRSILADFVWIKGYGDWERRDQAKTEAMVQLATTLDPRSVYFWDDGSAKISADISAMRMREAMQQGKRLEDVQDPIWREQGLKALSLLDRGLQFHPDNPRLLQDKAMIYQDKLHDLSNAAEQYRLAAAVPNSPYYLARIYVVKLRELGRNREAYAKLREIYPTLPNDDPAAEKPSVWGSLRELEDILQLPPNDRLPDSAAPPGWTPPTSPALTRIQSAAASPDAAK